MSAADATPSPWAARLFVGTLGAAVLWSAFEAIWYATGTPAPLIDHRAVLTEQVAQHQPPGRDGWPILADATTTYSRIHDDMTEARRQAEPDASWLELRELLSAPPDAERFRWEHRLLEEVEAAGVLDRLDEVAACPRLVRPLEGEGPLLLSEIPMLGDIRHLAVARVADMRVAAVRGDDLAQVRAFEHALACARAAANQGFIIDRLVAQAIFQMAADELACELIERPPDAETARALRAAFARQTGRQPSMVRAIETERILAHDFAQWAFTDDGHGDGRLDLERVGGQTGGVFYFGGGITGVVSGSLQAGRRETLDLLDAYYDALAADAVKSPAQRIADGPASAVVLASLTPRHMVVQTMLPALDRAIEQDDVQASRLVAFEIQLALAEYRALHGDHPETLDALVPAQMDVLPVDPAGGKPFAYRRLESCVQDVPYLLYGLGADGTDDTADRDLADLSIISSFSHSVTIPGTDVLYTRWRKVAGD